MCGHNMGSFLELTWKNLQKAWRTIAQHHFRGQQESLAAWKQNMKK